MRPQPVAQHTARAGVFLMLGAVLSSCGGTRLAAQEAPEPASAAARPDRGDEHLAQMKRSAEAYQITLNTEPPRRLELRMEPVLRWSNPLRITSDGAVFLWLSEGRPEVIASFYQFQRNGMTAEDHEFQSLATTGLTATRGDSDVWFPRDPGVTLAPIPDAPAPAGTPAERLRQMRALAREFRAFLDRPNNKSELRLLSQPLFRYETRRADLSDGALFSFVLTTDPEVLLLIEARPYEGKLAWHYALTRMSMMELRVERKGTTVWQVPFNTEANSRKRPYLITPAPAPPAGDGF
ncbi:MAG: hypothetical protein P4L84_20950 [Isosphaeraceae bacterium]|nr:hypothetical protein [Isosphaeraceae bacterium]